MRDGEKNESVNKRRWREKKRIPDTLLTILSTCLFSATLFLHHSSLKRRKQRKKIINEKREGKRGKVQANEE